jgi:hypothetical protein
MPSTVAKTAQARGVEVDALVGEAAPLVDLQRPVASGEALHGGGRHLIGNDVLRVHPAAQLGLLVQLLEIDRLELVHRAFECAHQAPLAPQGRP